MSDAMSRLRRGLLLKALNAQYPHPMMEMAIELQTKPYYAGAPRALVRDLAYLVDSEYASRQAEKVAGATLTSYRITPQGIDVLEGSTADPGIEVAA